MSFFFSGSLPARDCCQFSAFLAIDFDPLYFCIHHEFSKKLDLDVYDMVKDCIIIYCILEIM